MGTVNGTSARGATKVTTATASTTARTRAITRTSARRVTGRARGVPRGTTTLARRRRGDTHPGGRDRVGRVCVCGQCGGVLVDFGVNFPCL